MNTDIHRLLDEAFAGIEMTCGIVQSQTIGCVLFNQQEMTVSFDDGCCGNVGLPAIWHGAHYGKPASHSLTLVPEITHLITISQQNSMISPAMHEIPSQVHQSIEASMYTASSP